MAPSSQTTPVPRANRFLAMPRRKQLLWFVVFTVILIIGLEVLVWAFSYTVNITTGKALVPPSMNRRFHPLLRGTGITNPYDYPQVTTFDPYTIYWSLPNLPGKPSVPFATDRHGLQLDRGKDPGRDLNKKGDTYRIFVLGGSTVLGREDQGITPATFAAFLEDGLSASANRKFEVITSGVSGFHSAQELAAFIYKLIYLQPDMIITFDGVNDAIHSSMLREYSINGHFRATQFAAIVDPSVYNEDSSPPSRWESLKYRSADFFGRFYMVRLGFKPFEEMGFNWPEPWERISYEEEKIFNYLSPTFRPQGVDAYVQNLKTMSAAARERRISIMHILQPTLAIELANREDTARPEDIAIMKLGGRPGDRERVNPEIFIDAWGQFFSRAQEAFAQQQSTFAGVADVWLDYSRFFKDIQDLSTVYYDRVHYNDDYIEVLTKAVAVDVLETCRRIGCSPKAAP